MKTMETTIEDSIGNQYIAYVRTEYAFSSMSEMLILHWHITSAFWFGILMPVDEVKKKSSLLKK